MSGIKQNLKDKIKVSVIVGPTSSGKTSYAINLLKNNGGAIISADSRQVYRTMDVGTGKVPINPSSLVKKFGDVWVVDGVSIYGYDLANPDEYFSAYDYTLFARKKLSELIAGHKQIIITGGTGFYIDLLTGRKTLNSSAPDLELRKNLEKESTEVLLSKLKELNADGWKKIDRNNTHRIIRAVEKELSNKKADPLPEIHEVEFVYYGLNCDRAYLYERVDRWLDYIWDNGLLEETKILSEKYPGNLKLNGLVYKSAVSYLNAGLSKNNAKQEAKWNLHAYIRRQITWFRANKSIKWVETAK